MTEAGGDMGGERWDLTPRREVRTGQTAPPFLRAPQQSLGRSSSMLPSRVGATGACVGLFFFGLSYSMWDLSSPPWDGILPPALGAQSRNHWTTGEVPSCVGLSGSVPSPSHECLNVLTHTHIHTHTHTHTGKLEDLEKSQVTFVKWMNFHMSWNLAD